MITACLLSWRRPYHIPTIIDHLKSFHLISEIIVWQNESNDVDTSEWKADKVIESRSNEFILGRFLASKEASNDCVFFQDDDLLVNNIEELHNEFLANKRKKVIANLADDWSSRHWNLWQVKSKRPPFVELGFGSIAAKEMVNKIWDWPYDRTLLQRKADKVFTVLNDYQEIRATESKIKRLFHNGKESGRDSNSLWLRKDHRPLTDKALPLILKMKEGES